MTPVFTGSTRSFTRGGKLLPQLLPQLLAQRLPQRLLWHQGPSGGVRLSLRHPAPQARARITATKRSGSVSKVNMIRELVRGCLPMCVDLVLGCGSARAYSGVTYLHFIFRCCIQDFDFACEACSGHAVAGPITFPLSLIHI